MQCARKAANPYDGQPEKAEGAQVCRPVAVRPRASPAAQARGRARGTRALIAGLDRPSRLAGEDPILSAQVDLVYQSWADGRRAELNTILARQTAIWMESVAEARQCFGKMDALRQVATRLAVREARSEAD